MEVTVEIGEGHGADVYSWLASDTEVTQGTAFSPPVPNRDETMGAGFELLNFVVANGLSLGSLVVSLASYRESRRRSTGEAPELKIRYRKLIVLVEGDGQEALRRLNEASSDEK